MNNRKVIIKTSLLIVLSIYPFGVLPQNNIKKIYEILLLNVDKENIEDLLKNRYPEGYYSVNIFINNQKKDVTILYFKNKDGELTPSINIENLVKYNISPSFYNIPLNLKTNFLLNEYSIKFKYHFSTQSLYLTIPQKAFENKKNLLEPSSLWNDGIPALFSSYNYFAKYGKANQIEQKINFNSGANLGAWRIRSHSHYHYTSKYKQFKLHSLYAYRQIHPLFATFYGGEFTPISRMLSTDKLIGIQMISSDLLSSNNLYAKSPIIEDTAETPSEIKVKQQGRIIYETIVPPGAFILDNLPVIGSNELILEIKEADGRIRRSTHYFTSMPNQLKKGKYQYNIIGGYSYNRNRSQYDNSNKPTFLLGEFSYGINQKITAYGAIRRKINTETYFSGLTLDFGRLGGIASDISYLKNDVHQFKYQFRYHKKWIETGTYLSFSSAIYQSKMNNFRSYHESERYKLKNNYSINFSQSIKQIGLFSINYHHKNHIDKSNKSVLNASLSSSIKKINYNIKYQRNKEINYIDNHFSLNFHIPLMTKHKSYHWVSNHLSYHSYNQNYKSSTSFGGNILENLKLTYSINYKHNFGKINSYNNISVNTQYQGERQSFYINSAKLSNNRYYLRTGINGAIVLHEDGITLAPRLGKTFAIINTNGVSGIKINNSSQTTTDNSGNLILSSMTPYRKNIIGLNIKTLPEFSHIKTQSKVIVPTLGAISKINFPISTGYNVLFTSNIPIPFAANVMVFDDNNNLRSTDFVYDHNRIFLSGISEKGRVEVKWGNAQDQQCYFHYDIKNETQNTLPIKKEINCQ